MYNQESATQSIESLRGFLNVELELVETLLGTATTYISTGNLEAAGMSLDHALAAIEAVHRFAPRLPTLEETATLSGRATQLQQQLEVVRGKVAEARALGTNKK